MTYLSLVSDLHRELGLQGAAPSSVSGNTGMNNRLCGWVADADYKIQTMYSDWNFLWKTHTWSTAVGVSEYAAPDDLGTYDTESLVIDSSSDEWWQPQYIPYKEWRDQWQHGEKDNDDPDLWAVTPAGNIILEPPPKNTKTAQVEYWSNPVKMSENTSQSAIPVRFRRIIVLLAKMMYAEFVRDTGLYASAMNEYAEMLVRLRDAELPERYETLSQPPMMRVVPV